MEIPGFVSWSPVPQALLAGTFTWAVTAAGAAAVFFTRTLPRRLLDAMLGVAAGVMLAASFFSLLLPAIELTRSRGGIPWLPAVVGLLAGGVVFRVADAVIPHLHPGLAPERAEGPTTSWRRSTLLVLAITLHNVPEGLAIGVAFGAVGPEGSLGAALALTLGIGLQNFPEGLAVSLPLRGEGLGRLRSFHYGQLSGVVEPAAAVLGAAAVRGIRPILPYALAFAAGAMLYVVVEELLPESQGHGNTDLATSGMLLGFAVMMWLDVAFG